MTRSKKAYLEEWQRVDDVQRCDPVEDNVRTHSGTAESAKLLKNGVNVTFKFVQTWNAPSSPKSSWQAVGEPDAPTWKLSGTPGTSAFWETSGVPSLPKKTRVQSYSSKAVWSISRSSEIAVP